MDWIIDNANWLFSGAGLAVVTSLCAYFFKKRTPEKHIQRIKSGNNSTNIQGGKNVNVKIGEKHEKR